MRGYDYFLSRETDAHMTDNDNPCEQCRCITCDGCEWVREDLGC